MKSIVIAALLYTSGYGIVESVRETPLVVVRLDDGQAITVVPSGMQLFEPGQRVLVVPDLHGARVEHADVPIALP